MDVETTDVINLPPTKPCWNKSRKRNQTHLTTPPPDDELEMPPKKRKTGHGTAASTPSGSEASEPGSDEQQEDNNETPRPPLRTARLSYSASQHSTQSGGSSPRKHLAVMNLYERRIKTGNFSDTASMPKLLSDLRKLLVSRLLCGRKILGSASEPFFQQVDSLHADFDIFKEDPEVYFSPERDQLGTTPAPEDAMYILESAAECAANDQAECGWSSDVHHEVLSQALRRRQPGKTFKTLVKFMSCSTSTLIKEYKLPSAPDKKIDYCIYIDPAHDTEDPGIADLIDNLRTQLPLYSINISGEISLLKTPLAIPVEIKRSGEGGDDAALQVSTWLEAQTEFLHQLISRCPDSGLSMDDIGYVPGLIIQGHSWNLVAATRRGNETVRRPRSRMDCANVGRSYGLICVLDRPARLLAFIRSWRSYRCYVRGLLTSTGLGLRS